MTFRFHHPDRSQSIPLLHTRQGTQISGQQIIPVLYSSVTILRCLVVLNLLTLEILPTRRIKILPNLPVQLLLIPLHRQHVIPSAFLDLFRNRSLASHCIQRHDTPRQFQLVQKLRHRRNLVRLLLRLHLSKHHSIATRPSADHMQRLHSTPAVMGTSLRLTVHRDDLAATQLHHIFHPTHETLLKSTHRQRRDDSCNRVIHRYPVDQRHIPAKPFQLRASKFFNVTPTLGSTDHRAHAQHDDINQLMLLVSINSRILQLREMLDQTFRRRRIHFLPSPSL